uniref:Uncharacterized protein n=1 Tax=Auxenochlorella protothecoides TaxID=3075 RepID=A0A1D1ZM49_AUXPR
MERSEVTGASGYSEGTTTLLGLSQSSRSQRSALSSLLRRGLAGSLAVALSPWRLLLAWASWWSGLLLSALSYLGATPTGFLPYSKYQELGNIVEHMHSREDAFRTTIRELQDKLDANNQDKRKALRKLKSTLSELELTHQRLGEGGGPFDADARKQGPLLTERPSSKSGLHISAAVLALAVWWFYSQDQPALQRKVVFSVLFPLAWAYVAALGSRRPPITLLCCACWFLTGFVAAYRLSAAQRTLL